MSDNMPNGRHTSRACGLDDGRLSQPPALDKLSSGDDFGFTEMLVIPLIPLRPVLPTALQLGIFGENLMVPSGAVSAEDEIDPPLLRGFFMPNLPGAPTHVSPLQIADAVTAIANSVHQVNNIIEDCDRVLLGAIEQRESQEPQLLGNAQTDRYSTNMLRALRADANIARTVVLWEVEACKKWVRILRSTQIDNGRPTVVDVRIRDRCNGSIHVRQAARVGLKG